MSKELSDVVLVLDKQHIIESIVPSTSEYSFLMNQPIQSILSPTDQECFLVFSNKLKQERSVIQYPMNIQLFDQVHSCFFNGYHDQTSYFITILFQPQTDQEVLKRIMMLNSQQINELRSLYKSIHTQDAVAYNEISKLNSELLNSKRVIEKQNMELLGYNKLLKKMATEDSLTGCFNRRHFYEFMREHILRDQFEGYSSIVMIDFNYFKQVNDQFGHDAGDRLLITFVQIVKELISSFGEIYRLGGDEFILYFPNKTVDETDHVLSSIEREFQKHSAIVSIAYGIVCFQHSNINHEHDLTLLIRKVDDLMYQNKHQMKLHQESFHKTRE